MFWLLCLLWWGLNTEQTSASLMMIACTWVRRGSSITNTCLKMSCLEVHYEYNFIFNTLTVLLNQEIKIQVPFKFSNIQVYFSEIFVLKWSSVKTYKYKSKIGVCSSKDSAFTNSLCTDVMPVWVGNYIYTRRHTKLKEITEACQLGNSEASIWQMFISCAAHQTIVGMSWMSTELQGM